MQRPHIQLSVEDLSPICDISSDHNFVILRSYFDGGNQPDSTQYDVISLASVIGISDWWRPFEREWKELLNKHNAPWLHTTDLMSLKAAPFIEDNGWNKDRRDTFLSDCVTVIERHLVKPANTRTRKPYAPGLIPRVVTISFSDFFRARAANPEVPEDITMLCATQAVTHVLKQGEMLGIDFHHLVFDQNEPFKGHIEDRQNNKKAKRHLQSLPGLNRIVSVTEADMRHVPALQMADLYAWCYSHKGKRHRHKWQNRLLQYGRWVDDRYDFDNLVKVFPGVADLVKSWGLPRRKPTR